MKLQCPALKKKQVFAVLAFILRFMTGCAQTPDNNSAGDTLRLFPYTYREIPAISSPSILQNGTEVIIAITDTGTYSLLPVTQEKGDIYSCQYDFNGKGNQTWTDAPDFPSLGKTGLHSDTELDAKKMITGRPVDVINYIAMPGRFSHSGFIAEDEDIISVLKGDNRLVSLLFMIHSEMAKPLFHVWNMIQGNYYNRRDQKTKTILYNGNRIHISYEAGKGYQESIFHDEIEGRFSIQIHRDLTDSEIQYLKKNYADLPEEKWIELTDKITKIRVSEMAPFYIQRYGFYEGHTSYRADPVAVAVIFGLKPLEEINRLLNNDLYSEMNRHFTN